MIDMPKHESVAVLTAARVGRLSMIDATGRPYLIPLRFVFHNDAVYMRIAHDGRKAEALAVHPRVCFETDVVTENFSHYASVIIEGAVADVTDLVEKEEALFRFHEKYAQLCGTGVPPRPVTITGVALRKLTIERLTGRKKEPDETVPAAPPSLYQAAPLPRRRMRVTRRQRA